MHGGQHGEVVAVTLVVAVEARRVAVVDRAERVVALLVVKMAVVKGERMVVVVEAMRVMVVGVTAVCGRVECMWAVGCIYAMCI